MLAELRAQVADTVAVKLGLGWDAVTGIQQHTVAPGLCRQGPRLPPQFSGKPAAGRVLMAAAASGCRKACRAGWGRGQKVQKKACRGHFYAHISVSNWTFNGHTKAADRLFPAFDISKPLGFGAESTKLLCFDLFCSARL